MLRAAVTKDPKDRAARFALVRGLQRAKKLDEALSVRKTNVVLDNTYLTRASRSEVVRVAHARGAFVRCIYIETPPHEALVNITWRMLEKHNGGRVINIASDASKRAKPNTAAYSTSKFAAGWHPDVSGEPATFPITIGTR